MISIETQVMIYQMKFEFFDEKPFFLNSCQKKFNKEFGKIWNVYATIQKFYQRDFIRKISPQDIVQSANGWS